MIYTCTMNPAIDLFVKTDAYLPSVVNRTTEEDVQPNGKGVNISFILNMLGIKNTAIGFSGGFTGKFIEEGLRKKGVETDFVEVEGTTRINVFTQVKNENTEYKLVNKGPEISREKIDQLLAKIDSLKKGDLLFVSGSKPKGVTDDVMLEIAKRAKENRIRLVIDTSSKIVLDCLAYRPYCIKPNHEELALWFNKKELSKDELIKYGHRLIKLGAQMVLISLGKDGCLFFSAGEGFYVNAPKGKVINTACSGDALLGTFIGSIELGASTTEALKKSVAAGSSTAFSPGLTTFLDTDELEKQMKVKKLEDWRV